MSQFSTIVRPLVAQFIKLRSGITCANFTPPYSIQHAVYQQHTKATHLYQTDAFVLKTCASRGALLRIPS